MKPVKLIKKAAATIAVGLIAFGVIAGTASAAGAAERPATTVSTQSSGELQ
ncbi:MAG TPA: hypothetical protein VHG10_15015 [Glycomyces sp.]|nr:hypothetical protein [Glycomyces sp.]